MIGKMTMDNMIETRNAADAPQENVEIPMTEAGINVPADTGNGLFPQGDDTIATNNIGTGPEQMNQGLPNGLTAPVDTPDTGINEQQVALEDQSAKDDPSRMQYWQSQNDKAKNENYKLQQELEYYRNTLSPISDAIKSDPELLDRLEQKNLSNSPQVGSPTQGNQTGQLKTPTRPQKPHSYNEVDAYNDPESDSFKYRLSNDQYRDDMLDYYGQVDQYRQQQAQFEQQRQQETMAVQNAQSHAINNYGWDNQKASQFVQWAQNPANVTLDHLAKIYEMSMSPSREQVENQQKVVQMQKQNERMNVPRTATVEKGTPAQTMTDEQSFSASLLAGNKR